MEDKIILIDKPTGISSFGVVAKVRQKLTQKFGHKIKVGHTGTLDPFATGLLILLTGKMTKKSNDFLKLDKVYEATLKLGYTSTTGDPEGKITKYIGEFQELSDSGAFGGYDREAGRSARNDGPERPVSEQKVLEIIIQSFIGEITQQVPKFSAVKINGKRAYKLAREGKDFEPPIRNVTIYNIELLDYHYPELKIRCHVSSGTYIRTLAEDIGKKLGTGAYLTSLRRIKIGNYDVKDAIIDLC